MRWRYTLVHLILAIVVALGLTPLMVCVDAQAQIVFVSDRNGNNEIYVMDIDGKNSRNLTNNRDKDYSPSWSPDGERIAFSSRRDGNFRNKFGLTDEIYVMDVDGGNQRRLTNNRGWDWYPSWSPDGERIAFASDRRGDFVNFEIYVMDADGGNPRRLTENRHEDSSPSWSPDGKRITFNSRRDGNLEIYVMDANGGNQQRLTNNNRQDDFQPAWYTPAFAVALTGNILTIWGRLKQID